MTSASDLHTHPLSAETGPDFARLVEGSNGVWGGRAPPKDKRKVKEDRVRERRAHAALVYEGEECVGWCQFGSPDELPRIHNQRAYTPGNPGPPDWRITCFFSGKGHRGRAW